MDIEQLKLILGSIQGATDTALPLAYFYLGSHILGQVIIGIVIISVVMLICKLIYRIHDASATLLQIRRKMDIGSGTYVDSSEISQIMAQIERWKIKDEHS